MWYWGYERESHWKAMRSSSPHMLLESSRSSTASVTSASVAIGGWRSSGERRICHWRRETTSTLQRISRAVRIVNLCSGITGLQRCKIPSTFSTASLISRLRTSSSGMPSAEQLIWKSWAQACDDWLQHSCNVIRVQSGLDGGSSLIPGKMSLSCKFRGSSTL